MMTVAIIGWVLLNIVLPWLLLTWLLKIFKVEKRWVYFVLADVPAVVFLLFGFSLKMPEQQLLDYQMGHYIYQDEVTMVDKGIFSRKSFYRLGIPDANAVDTSGGLQAVRLEEYFVGVHPGFTWEKEHHMIREYRGKIYLELNGKLVWRLCGIPCFTTSEAGVHEIHLRRQGLFRY